jgi:ferredoxin-NADP reductase/MOSC domain-containing protein YiiM
LLSVNIGLPRDVAWDGRTVHTGIWKRPIPGPHLVRRLNIDGDGQGDTAGHGGENRAVLVYQIESYDHWRTQLDRDDLAFGEFGENFTVTGLADDEVCIGDRYRIGDAEFEVTQPRVTCFRVGMRLGRPDMPSLLVAHHRPGFYLRVLTEGHVQAGDEVVRLSAGPHRMSVAEIDTLLYLPGRDPARLRRALDIAALSQGWQGSFRELLTRADRTSATPATAAVTEPGWTGFRPLRVVDATPESTSVTSIRLRAEDGTPLPVPRAGQYLTIRAAGAGHPAPVRSYSLSSAPGADTYRISVKREAHGVVSGYLHTGLRPGDILDAAAPRGGFVLADGTNPVLLISAGIGVTPVIAMLHDLVSRGSARDVWWIHGARNPSEHALAREAHEQLARLTHAHEHVYYSAATSDESHLTGVGRGRLTPATLAALDLPTDAAAYICGPAEFMAATREGLVGQGLDPDNIHTELFGPADAINPGLVGQPHGPPHQPPGPPGTGPPVTFARSGITVPYTATTNPSLLELAEACDVPTRWSCRTGVCHTCATPLLAGQVSYSPAPLEPPAPDIVLTCCARPGSEVVLDM